MASTSDLDDPVGFMPDYIPNLDALAYLKQVCPDITVDDVGASEIDVAERLRKFWIPETAVVYIGLAGTSLRDRIRAYYGTRLGLRSPHSGGWWLKTLVGLETLFVHCADSSDPEGDENALVRAFASRIPREVAATLHDRERLAPFANVKVLGSNKRHGLKNYKIAKKSRNIYPAPGTLETRSVLAPSARIGSTRQDGVRVESQVITEGDRKGSNLRIPSRSMFALPREDGYLTIVFEGRTLQARWRVNGTRSGTIGLGKAIMQQIGRTNESMWLTVSGSTVTIEA